jgi:hypothetical protein
MRYREAFRARPLVVGVLVLGVLGGAPVAAQATTLKVVPIGHGTVSFTPAPQSPAASDPCSGAAAGQTTDLLSGSCAVTYAPGTVVRLQAIEGVADPANDDPATTFRRWSDDRCPPGNTRVCELTVGSEPVTIAALFSPQRVSVQLEGAAGTVSISPAGLLGGVQPAPCDVANVSQCHDDFDPDLSGPVTLTAAGIGPTWAPTAVDGRTLCDSLVSTTCSVVPAWPRWGSVGFGVPPNNQVPSAVTVNFRIAKAGNGSGTVRSTKLNCGGQCSIETGFGQTETLTAVPDSGSRFDGWRAACGSAPTCSLAVGPVTSLTAVFDRGAGGGAGGGATQPGGTKPPQSRAFAARVLRLSVRGHGRRRTISIRLRVNATATVRARLLRGRRQIAAHRWRVRTGIHVLRMRVPPRARPGNYKVRLSINGGSRTVRITRNVRLRR